MWMIIEALEYDGGCVHIFMSREDALNWHGVGNTCYHRVLIQYNGEFETLSGELDAHFHDFPDGAYDFGGMTYYYESGVLRATVDRHGHTNYYNDKGRFDKRAHAGGDK